MLWTFRSRQANQELVDPEGNKELYYCTLFFALTLQTNWDAWGNAQMVLYAGDIPLP